MATGRTCCLCGGAMEAGIIRDRGESNLVTQQEWGSAQQTKRHFLGLIPYDAPAVVLKVSTWRCTRCGYLMEFAVAPQDE